MPRTALKITAAAAAIVGWMALSAFSPAPRKIELGLRAASPADISYIALQVYYDQESIGAANRALALMVRSGGAELAGEVAGIADGTFRDGSRVGG